MRVPVVVNWKTLQRNEFANITAAELHDLFWERWVAVYRRPARLRVDPEGAWKGKEHQSQLATHNIELDVHAGQASWQLGITENAINHIKAIATKVARMNPDLSPKVVMAIAVQCFMEEERAFGYSPSQWAFGRQPTWEDSLSEEAWPERTSEELLKKTE